MRQSAARMMVLVLALAPHAATAANVGPLLEELAVAIAEHAGEHYATEMIDRALRGPPKPDLSITDTQLQAAAEAAVVHCIQEANWLDGHNPGTASDPSQRADYDARLEAYRGRCSFMLKK